MFKLANAEFVLFDVETTGLSPVDGDRIIELAALKIRNGKVIDRLVSFVDPGRALSAQEVHGITESMLVGAPTSAEFLPQMIDFVAGGVLVAHNASFDIKFLSYELSLAGRRLREETPVLDTIKMARLFLPHLTSYRLGYIACSLGIPAATAHRALADAETLAGLMNCFLAMAPEHNITSLTGMVERFSVEKPVFRAAAREQESLF